MKVSANISFLYNGKELQTQLGLEWLDYGARLYDAQVGRFWTQDRFAEKYLSMTMYQYGANNPIRYVDVNGDSIYIYEKNGNRYKYDQGKLYLWNNGTYIEYTAEAGSFAYGIYSSLNELVAGGDAGKSLVDFFHNEYNTLLVRPNKQNINENSGATVLMNSKLKGSIVPTEDGALQSEFYIALGHEMAHTKDYYLRGSDKVRSVWFNGDGIKATESEKYATHIENQLRSESGLSLRTHYAINQDGSGHEPTRIIDRKGTSLYYQTTYTFGNHLILGATPPSVTRILNLTTPFKYK